MYTKNSTTKISVVEIFVNRVIERVQKEQRLPWCKPWNPLSESGAYNAVSGRHYNGLNTLILEPGAYLTFKEVQNLGGKVRKGAKALPVFFWKQIIVTDSFEDENGNPVEDSKLIPMLRYYNVFALADCDIPEAGMKKLKLEPEKVQPENKHADDYPVADALYKYYLNREGINVNPSQKAFYRPSTDSIGLPVKAAFPKIEEYFGTAFHEITHSTGAKNRLNRAELVATAGFGSKTYSKEELTAEIGACFLCSYAGVDISVTENNNVAYLQGWLNALKNDPQMLISAHSKARKAFEFVIDGFEYVEEPEEPENVSSENDLVHDWYEEQYPDDDLADEIDPEITFKDVYKALGIVSDIYDVLGNGCDSVIRERVFQKIADIYRVDYDDVYNKWAGVLEEQPALF